MTTCRCFRHGTAALADMVPMQCSPEAVRAGCTAQSTWLDGLLGFVLFVGMDAQDDRVLVAQYGCCSWVLLICDIHNIFLCGPHITTAHVGFLSNRCPGVDGCESCH